MIDENLKDLIDVDMNIFRNIYKYLDVMKYQIFLRDSYSD